MANGFWICASIKFEDYKKDFKNLHFEEIEEDLYKVKDVNGSLFLYLKNGYIDVFEFGGNSNNGFIFKEFLNKYKCNYFDDSLAHLASLEERQLTNFEIKNCMESYGDKFH
jgi:hypothetical protein